MEAVKISEVQLRAYAAGTLGWSVLRDAGVHYGDVLAGLGDLGLRPPIAPPGGINAAARERGLRMLREAIAKRQP